MRIGHWIAVALTVAAAACGDDSGGDAVADGSPSADVTPPSETCADGEELIVAAYDLVTGDRRWATCSSDAPLRRDIAAATDEAVWVTVTGQGGERTLVAYGADDGSELAGGGPAEGRPSVPAMPTGPSPGPVVDGVRIEGGQDDPTSAFDAASGRPLWSNNPGSPVYDDVWAVGDGAVYVVDRGGQVPRLIAYDLRSGDARWERDLEPIAAGYGPWPWHVSDEVLFTIWTNLALISTDDGSTIWRTDYPDGEFPRMSGVAVNDDTVFIAFSSVRSGGD
jgi:outer membrane protein assembly factor BamB